MNRAVALALCLTATISACAQDGMTSSSRGDEAPTAAFHGASVTDNHPSRVSAPIDPGAGGAIELQGVAKIVVSSGGVSGPATVEISRLSLGTVASPTAALRLSAPVNLRLGEGDLVFGAQVTLAFDPELLPSDSPIYVVFPAYFDEEKGAWVPIDECDLDPGGSVSFETDHLSTWQVLGFR